ncbi:hypothetical protein [Brachyspira pulli]|uniref:hypothetical protein n=1 Tax=Brachyspira pulli TaxID=310721 RepID=UPI003005B709
MTKNLKIDLIALLADKLNDLDNEKFKALFSDEDFDSMDADEIIEELETELRYQGLLDSFNELNEKINNLFYPEESFDANKLIREYSSYKSQFKIDSYNSDRFCIRINGSFNTVVWVRFENNSYEIRLECKTLDNADWSKKETLENPRKIAVLNQVDSFIMYYFDNKERLGFL